MGWSSALIGHVFAEVGADVPWRITQGKFVESGLLQSLTMPYSVTKVGMGVAAEIVQHVDDVLIEAAAYIVSRFRQQAMQGPGQTQGHAAAPVIHRLHRRR